MRAFTLKTEIVSVDKSSKEINKINKAYDKMTNTISRESKIAGNAFSTFAKKVGVRAKQIQVGINNMNASVNRTFRKISSSKLALGFGIGLLAIIGSITQANIQLDASIASLQAITGKTGTEFISFRKEIDSLSKSEKLFAGDTAKAFEIVGSAQPILLKSAENLGLVTKAAITLKKAGLIPIEDSAKAVTGTMNQFELGANQAQRVINVLAAGAKEGSANIQLLSESMDRVGAVAKAANMSVEQTGAAVELMSKFNLKGSEAGISLKSTILRLKSAALGFASGQFNLNDALNEYNQQMTLIKDPIKKAAREEAVFGKIHILTGKILTENIGELDRLTTAMTGTNEATIQANINNNTFKNRLTEISAAWKNSITATEGQGKQMQFLKDIMVKVADNMDRIVSFAVILIKLFLAFKAIVYANAVIMGTYNIALGIMGALSGSASIAIGSSTIALQAYNIASKAASVATWLFSAALWANPITWIVIGIIALIAIIVLLVKNWDKVTAAIKKVWEQFKNTAFIQNIIAKFKAFVAIIQPLIDKLKEIGKAIKEFIIDKFKKVSEFVSKIVSAVQKFFGKDDDSLIVGGDVKKEIEITNSSDTAMVSAINKNTDELEKNTSATKDGWTGRFTTSVLKDANISEKSTGLAQREIATSAIVNEQNITNTQKDVIASSAPQSVITQNSSRQKAEKQTNGQITVNIVDKTGGKFGLEVESTGIEVTTTGNA